MQWYFPSSILHLWKMNTICEGTIVIFQTQGQDQWHARETEET